MKVFLFLAVCLLCFISCSNNIDPNQLAGTYITNNGSSESIIITKDHAYKHIFRTKSGCAFENKGTWTYDSRTKQISFNYFIFQLDMPAGTWVSKVKTTYKGEIRLIYSSEEDLYYMKNN
ncbi:hypothetical protein ACFJIV_14210 [Mucilaginibacter sp. UC70_90]